jgi:hypothetical protein
MARKSSSAKARHEKKLAELKGELEKCEGAIRALLSSDESRLAKTQKQKALRERISDIKSRIQMLSI